MHSARCWMGPSPAGPSVFVPGPNEQSVVAANTIAPIGGFSRLHRLWVSSIPAPGQFVEVIAQWGTIAVPPLSAVSESRVFLGNTIPVAGLVFAQDVDRLIINNSSNFNVFWWVERPDMWVNPG